MVRATVGVVTNVRTDHTEVMGASLAGDRRRPSRRRCRATASSSSARRTSSSSSGSAPTALGTRVVVAGPPPARPGAPWLERGHRDGARGDAAPRRAGRRRAPRDVRRPGRPGRLPRARSRASRAARSLVLDARAANDPESFALLCRTLDRPHGRPAARPRGLQPPPRPSGPPPPFRAVSRRAPGRARPPHRRPAGVRPHPGGPARGEAGVPVRAGRAGCGRPSTLRRRRRRPLREHARPAGRRGRGRIAPWLSSRSRSASP